GCGLGFGSVALLLARPRAGAGLPTRVGGDGAATHGPAVHHPRRRSGGTGAGRAPPGAASLVDRRLAQLACGQTRGTLGRVAESGPRAPAAAERGAGDALCAGPRGRRFVEVSLERPGATPGRLVVAVGVPRRQPVVWGVQR